MDNNSYFDCEPVEWKKILNTKINFSFNDKQDLFDRSRFVTLYVKDMNYNEISEISSPTVANIENFREAINFFMNSNFKIVRIEII